ncbi:reverse transcriptase domain-containing protein [Tanacetum coccineum]
MTNLTDMLSKFVNSNTDSTSGSGTLPSNTIANPKVDLKGITTRSGVAYQGPIIPTTSYSLPKAVERETDVTKDTVPPTNNGSTKDIQPPVVQVQPHVPNSEPVVDPVSAPMPNPKPKIPYPSRRNDQKSRDKASNQMEKIFQIFQDLRYDISFADALLLMPRFAPTIKSLLTNKEKLLELAKIPLNENCSAMLLKKLPEKLGDPRKFLIPCNFPGMDVCHTLANLGTRINLIPLSIWKKLSLPKLTPTRMTLELADRSITHPKGLAEDVFIKIGKFHFPTNFVVVDFEAGPRVPLILGRSFLRTSRALIDVFEGELILRDGNEQIIFHVDDISKHPQKHVNKSIKIINDTCEDSFERFTDEPALVCLPPPEDDDDKKEKQDVKNFAEPTVKRQIHITPCLKNFKVMHKESIFHSSKMPQISSVFAITSALPKDSLIMGDEHLSTFRVEEIVPIPRESKDTFDKGCDLTFCDNNMIFSNPLFGSKDYLTSRDDKSFLKQDVQEENFQVYSNPLFEFDDNHNSSNINPLFNEMLEDCFDPGGDNDEIDAFLAIEVSTNIKEGYYDSEGDVFYLESLLSDDTTHNLSPEVFFDHEPQHFKNESDHDTLITFSPKNDPLHHKFAGEIITNPSRIAREHEEYISRMWLLCGNSSSRSPKNFHASPNTIIESLPIFPITVQDSDSHREEIDIFPGPNDLILPEIKRDDYDSEDDENSTVDEPVLLHIPFPD